MEVLYFTYQQIMIGSINHMAYFHWTVSLNAVLLLDGMLESTFTRTYDISTIDKWVSLAGCCEKLN